MWVWSWFCKMTSSNGNIFRVTGHLCGALMFSLISAWIDRWVNNGEAGDLRRHRAHYVDTVMVIDGHPIIPILIVVEMYLFCCRIVIQWFSILQERMVHYTKIESGTWTVFRRNNHPHPVMLSMKIFGFQQNHFREIYIMHATRTHCGPIRWYPPDM